MAHLQSHTRSNSTVSSSETEKLTPPHLYPMHERTYPDHPFSATSAASTTPFLGPNSYSYATYQPPADMESASPDPYATRLSPPISDDKFDHPLELPFGDLRRASVAASLPLSGRRNYAPVHWPNVVVLLIAVAGCWCLGQFGPAPWVAGTSLTVARIIVAIIGVVIGLACGYALLLRIGRRTYEAVMYSTLVHNEMALYEIDRCAEPGPLAALHLLLYRLSRVKRADRPYDRRPWSIWIIYFLFVGLLANIGGFLYGRTVIIYTVPQRQFASYHPIPVLGELTDDDLSYASLLEPAFQSYQFTWTLASPASISVPSSASLPLPNPDSNNTIRSIFFTDASSSLFSPTAVGPAASLWDVFMDQETGAKVITDDATQSLIAQGVNNNLTGEDVPVAVEFPMWGAEIECATFTELRATVAVSATGDMTASVPTSALQGLVGQVGADSGLVTSAGVFNITNGAIQAGPFPNNGVASDLYSKTLDSGGSGNGYVATDVLLVRLNSSTASNGMFLSMADVSGTIIGIDGAACATRISPFIIRAIDSSGVVTLSEIVSEGASFTSASEGIETPLFTAATTNQALTSSGKSAAFFNAFYNSRNTLVKDNGRDFPYVPNPTLVQMTNISQAADIPPNGYGVLDSEAVKRAFAGLTTRYLLPYLVGQGRVEGRAFTFTQVAYAFVKTVWLALFMGVILVAGLVGAFFVPRPPFNLPNRELNPSNWLTFADQMPRNYISGINEDPKQRRVVKLRYGK